MSLPKYSPKNPIRYSMSFDEAVAAYGNPPDGYKWLKVGDKTAPEDIIADGNGWSFKLEDARPISYTWFPVARKVSDKAPRKVSADLQKLLEEAKWLEKSIVNANKRLAEIKKAIRGLT